MAEAAQAWLESLDEDQHAVALGAVPEDGERDAERRRWFYTPTDHGGLTVHRQRSAQQRRAMALVATGLSEAGYVTVATTIGLENVLDHAEGFRVLFDRERAAVRADSYGMTDGTSGSACPCACHEPHAYPPCPQPRPRGPARPHPRRRQPPHAARPVLTAELDLPWRACRPRSRPSSSTRPPPSTPPPTTFTPVVWRADAPSSTDEFRRPGRSTRRYPSHYRPGDPP
jgi:Protein of unknown function (DUF3500)